VGRDLAVGLSLATLWFIGAWSDLLPFLYISDRFPIGALPCWNDFLAVVLNVTVLGGLFALLRRACRKLSGTALAAADWLFLASFVVPANTVRNHFHTPVERLWERLPAHWSLAVAVLAAVTALGVLARWRRPIVRGISIALVIVFPLVPMTFAQAGWAITQAGGRLRCDAAGPLAPRLSVSPPARVLWLVYDELEQHAVFDGRPTDLRMPAFDRLRREAFHATAALPPGDRTERTIPAVLTGVSVLDSALVGRNELRVTLAGSVGPSIWDGDLTLFARARALGVNTAAAGFFLPYCALLGDVLSDCAWQPCTTCGRMVGAFGEGVLESMRNQASELAPFYSRRRHLAAYRALQDAARSIATDPAIGFALLHLPVPHEPPIYDRRRGAFSVRRPSGAGYYDNLALADRSLGELRRAMEAAGTWIGTTLFVFGDHGRRAEGNRIDHPAVPFIVKLAGQAAPARYEAPFNLVLLHDLTLAVLTGRLTTPEHVAAWLDAHRSASPAAGGSGLDHMGHAASRLPGAGPSRP
jgi:hypothetical protein